MELSKSVLGEALSLRCTMYISDCTAFMQSSHNPNTDIFLATSHDAVACMLVAVMYHRVLPVIALYINLSCKWVSLFF